MSRLPLPARRAVSFSAARPPYRWSRASAAARSAGLRISDSDRERAAERLEQALAEGRITVAELEERVAAVYAARYADELRPPLADLPGDDVVEFPAAEPLVLRAGASGIKRSGKWSVPARMLVKSLMGSVVLDFCETAIAHPVVEIELVLGTGSGQAARA
jgi:hypothetical protein